MHTTYLLASLVAAASCAAAKKAPYYCEPPSKVDDDNTFQYLDMSSACASANAGSKHCCVSVVDGDNSCGKFTQADLADLEAVLKQQVDKKGQFKISKQGRFTASFPLLYKQVHDKNALQPWLDGIADFAKNPPSWGPGDIYFMDDKDVVLVQQGAC